MAILNWKKLSDANSLIMYFDKSQCWLVFHGCIFMFNVKLQTESPEENWAINVQSIIEKSKRYILPNPIPTPPIWILPSGLCEQSGLCKQDELYLKNRQANNSKGHWGEVIWMNRLL